MNNTTLLIKGGLFVFFFFWFKNKYITKIKRIKSHPEFQRIAMNSIMASFINVYPLKLIVY